MKNLKLAIIGLASCCVALAACEEKTESDAAPPAAPAAEIGLDDLAVPDRLASPRDAVADFTSACDDGDGLACNELGKHYLARPGAEKTALNKFSESCGAKHLEGCNNRAVMELRAGVKDKKRLQKAVDLLQRACDGAVAAACANLSLMLQDQMTGAGARVAEAAKKGCDAGYDRACVVGARGLATGKKPDRPAARRALEEACAAGRAVPCRLLGKPAPGEEDFDELEPISDPFACSGEGWLKQMAEAMDLDAFVPAKGAAADKPDCDLWIVL